MAALNGKKVLLGITAGIAAYKTTFLVRLFIKAGAEVKVVMTPAAKDFVTPLTLSALSNNPVYYSFVSKEENEPLWNSHVELGLWADFMLIAPATANTLSKMADGICDNLLLATYLSVKCPVYFAPTMDLDMYQHPSTKENINKLQSFGNIFIPATSGFLASGLEGEGRMAEPEEIIQFIENDLISKLPLRDKTVLITAGPTYEAIDPVRFIGNHSSGKMGFELANRAAQLGANVILITGPTSEKTTQLYIKRIDVVSADEMYQTVHTNYNKADIVIMSAAVSDYKPAKPVDQKIKKSAAKLTLELVPTNDILASLGVQKTTQFLVGFALETADELANAEKKLETKNLDLIVLNSLNDEGAGFKKMTNKVTIIDKFKKKSEFSLKSKAEVAVDIFDLIISKLHE